MVLLMVLELIVLPLHKQYLNVFSFTLQNFKSLLVEELSKHFPKEIDEYQKIKERQLKT